MVRPQAVEGNHFFRIDVETPDRVEKPGFLGAHLPRVFAIRIVPARNWEIALLESRVARLAGYGIVQEMVWKEPGVGHHRTERGKGDALEEGGLSATVSPDDEVHVREFRTSGPRGNPGIGMHEVDGRSFERPKFPHGDRIDVHEVNILRPDPMSVENMARTITARNPGPGALHGSSRAAPVSGSASPIRRGQGRSIHGPAPASPGACAARALPPSREAVVELRRRPRLENRL